MKCSELMTREVKSVKKTDDVFHAARLMREHKIGFLPVHDAHGRLVGVVTDRDLAMKVCAADREPVGTEVGDVMSHPVVTCRATEPVARAEREMTVHGLRRIVVVDAAGRAVGVVSATDIARSRSGDPDVEVRR